MIYENKYYKVVKDLVEENGEYLNWAVINKQHDTVECRTAILPSAIITADNMSDHLSGLVKGDKPAIDLVVDNDLLN